MATAVNTVALTTSEHRLPLTAAAKRLRRRADTDPWAARLRRWLWPVRVHTQPCDRCHRSMLEYQQVGAERLCIRCVSDSQVALASPALAGAIAVLRALWLEEELERLAQRARPFEDRRRLSAIRETGELLMWWLTPRALRPPDVQDLGETGIREAIADFDHKWSLRCSQRTLSGIYAWWVRRHAQMLSYTELTAIDRRYAALIASEPPSPARAAVTRGGG